MHLLSPNQNQALTYRCTEFATTLTVSSPMSKSLKLYKHTLTLVGQSQKSKQMKKVIVYDCVQNKQARLQ